MIVPMHASIGQLYPPGAWAPQNLPDYTSPAPSTPAPKAPAWQGPNLPQGLVSGGINPMVLGIAAAIVLGGVTWYFLSRG